MAIFGRCEYCGQVIQDTSGICYNANCPSRQNIFSNHSSVNIENEKIIIDCVCSLDGSCEFSRQIASERDSMINLLKRAAYVFRNHITEVGSVVWLKEYDELINKLESNHGEINTRLE
jgi:hypothetical protein